MIKNSNEIDRSVRYNLIDTIAADLALTKEQMRAARHVLATGDAKLYVDGWDTIIGGIGYMMIQLPDSIKYALVERLLWVHPLYRHSGIAAQLVKAFEEEARDRGCVATMAGSSLGNNEHTERLYTGMGYQVNHTYRKEL